MKIAYVINSLSRPESCSDTVKAVRKFDVKHYVFLFVEKQELKIYRNVLNKLGTVKVRLIKLPETGKGVGYSRKFSLEYVNYLKYDYIITLDDDVLLLNNPIPLVKKMIRRNIDLVGFWRSLYDFYLKEVKEEAIRSKDSLVSTICAHVCGAAIIKVASAIEVGGYDRHCLLNEDDDLNANLSVHGYKIMIDYNTKYNKFLIKSEVGGCSIYYKAARSSINAVNFLNRKYGGNYSYSKKYKDGSTGQVILWSKVYKNKEIVAKSIDLHNKKYNKHFEINDFTNVTYQIK